AGVACGTSAPTRTTSDGSHVAAPPAASTPREDGGIEIAAEATALLAIPPRSQAAESPPSGWCGETAIQEGLLYFGEWVPQQRITQAGRPAHPDLYASEIPRTLTALGVRFTPYARGKGYEGFARWAREAIDAGEPVLAGVKLLPTQHPSWGLDHFVL